MRISVIIPTFNEEIQIIKTLDEISNFENLSEIIVVDGGSTDNTIELIENYKATEKLHIVVTPEANRGLQMHEGTKYASGEILWFVHADTQPDRKCAGQILQVMREENVSGGNFRIIFDGDSGWSRFLTWLYPKLRRLNLIYGDSAIFVRKKDYESIDGFSDLPLFEDVDLYKRLRRRGKFVHLDLPVTTSSRRFKNRSFVWTFTKWSLFQGLYWLGFPPRLLAKGYKTIR